MSMIPMSVVLVAQKLAAYAGHTWGRVDLTAFQEESEIAQDEIENLVYAQLKEGACGWGIVAPAWHAITGAIIHTSANRRLGWTVSTWDAKGLAVEAVVRVERPEGYLTVTLKERYPGGEVDHEVGTRGIFHERHVALLEELVKAAFSGFDISTEAPSPSVTAVLEADGGFNAEKPWLEEQIRATEALLSEAVAQIKLPVIDSDYYQMKSSLDSLHAVQAMGQRLLIFKERMRYLFRVAPVSAA